VLGQLSWRELNSDLSERIGGLASSEATKVDDELLARRRIASRCRTTTTEGGRKETHLLPNKGLLNSSQVLQRSQHQMGVLLSSNVLSERSQLLGKSEKDLVLVVELILEEGNELLSSSLRSEGESDGGEATDGSETEGNVVGFELVCGMGIKAKRKKEEEVSVVR